MLIKDVVELRPDVLSGNFQGDLRAYRVGRESEAARLENDPKLFFAVTYPSASLQRFVERVHQKLKDKRVQRAWRVTPQIRVDPLFLTPTGGFI